MNVTDVLAIIGAFTGSAALLWDVFKWWHTGARVRVSVSPDMVAYGAAAAALGEEANVFVEAVNVGDGKTTITHLVGYHYGAWYKLLLRRKPKTQFAVLDPAPGRIPFELAPGERWVGVIEQNADLEKMSTEGWLYVGVTHTTKRKPVLVRLVIAGDAA